jgi:hypothetical protein
MKKLIERELNPLTFAAAQTSTLQLPRDYSFDKLAFRLTMALTRTAVTAGGLQYPTGVYNFVKDVSGAQVIKRIEIRRNGREVLKSIDFETLMRLNQLRNGTAPQRSLLLSTTLVPDTTWDATGAAATSAAIATAINFDLSATLEFGMWNSIRRNDTLLDSTSRGNVSTLDLIITWGNLQDVMIGGLTGGVVSASVTPKLEIATTEYIDIDTKDDPYTPYADNKEYSIRKIITATNPKEQIELGVGNFYRSLVIKTSADDFNRDDIINYITLRSGTDVIKYRAGKPIKWDNKIECSLEVMPAGYYLLEHCKDGHLAKMLNTTNMSSLTIELDVTKQGTTCVVEVFPVEVVGAVRRVA